MFKKLKTIILSRFKKEKADKEIERKKSICAKCSYNSINATEISYIKRLLIKISRFYSWITGNLENDSLGECTFCSSCSVYYKIIMNDECGKGNWDLPEKENK